MEMYLLWSLLYKMSREHLYKLQEKKIRILIKQQKKHNVYNITFGTYNMNKTWYAEIPQLQKNIEDMTNDE